MACAEVDKRTNHSKRALVTGGGGFLGKAIVKRLIEKGYSVRSLCRRRYGILDRLGVEQIQGDINDPSVADEACRGMSVVFHSAAKAGVWGPYGDFFATNVSGTRNVIESCRQNNVPRLIFTSSASVVFDGTEMAGTNESAPYPSVYPSDYQKTKAMAEREVIRAGKEGLLTLTLRPHLIWGPEDNHLIPRILARAKKVRIVGSGKNMVDTIYIDNAAEAHLLADKSLMMRPELSGNVYFISQDEPVNLWEMINRILAAGGLPPIKRSIPKGAAYAAGAVAEWLYRLLGIQQEPQMTRFVAQELAASHWFDISAAKKDLGYVPHISTQEGLERLRRWLARKDGN